MVNPAAAARRALPSVDRLLGNTAVEQLITAHGRTRVTETLRRALDTERARLAQPEAAAYDEAQFLQSCADALIAGAAPSLKPVFNLTGTVLHTNLGRSVMPKKAAEAVMAAMTRPVNLEFDLATGARGERDSHVERWLRELTGGEKAVAVNNNAAAVYLALNTLALRKEVLVSRGELIEIGGAFHPRHHVACRRKTGRGRHHQSHPPQGFCRSHHPAHCGHHESAHQQLRGAGFHRDGA